jgi:methyltransferase (TIGR00027 family)
MRNELPPLAQTAVATAVSRAAESLRDDRLFDDPLAGRFVAAAGRDTALPGQVSRQPRTIDDFWSWFAHFAPVRIRFFDDCVRAACADGCRQVVILAAGLDARAFRLPWPDGVRLYELDQPDVLAFKNAVLASEGAVPHCARVTVEADLRQDWPAPLRQAGFRPEEPTFWLAEGLLAYLTVAERDQLLDAVDALSAPGSVFALEYVSKPAVDLVMGVVGDSAAFAFALWQPGSPEDPVSWFGRRGWRAEASDASERAAFYGRPAPPFADPALARMLGEGPVARDSVIVGRRPARP